MRAHWHESILLSDSQGRATVASGATVYAYQQGTSSVVTFTLYSEDDTTGSTTLANPFTVPNDGEVSIYTTDEQRFDLVISKTGHTTKRVTIDTLEQTATSSIVVKDTGVAVGTRPAINFIDGANVTITTADDAVNNEVDITIAASAASETDPLSIHKSLIDAKGDLIAGSAADTAARLAVGADGTFLKADSAQASGLTWASGGGVQVDEFTASGTWTKPAGAKLVLVQIWGGGGGGASNSGATNAAAGGGGGGSLSAAFNASELGATETVTIGAGGTGAARGAGAGTAGGTSTFGTHLRGVGGTSAPATASGGGEGAAVSNPVGFEGGTASANGAAFGGAAGGNATIVGGSSMHGGAGGGGGGNTTTAGADGGKRGTRTAGGGAAGGAANGGTGANGAAFQGAGGGGGLNTGLGGAGGTGGTASGGGGGGAGSSIANNGPGGNGGNGYCRVTTYL